MDADARLGAVVAEPTGPHLAGVVEGETGSGKSTFCRFLARLVDPRARQLTKMPRDSDDLMIAAYNRWVVATAGLICLPE